MRRGTQQEQLKAALRAYILPLNTSKESRFSVYLDSGEGLEVLWPSDSYLISDGGKSQELLPSQTYWKRNDNYPAFHFHYTGYGSSYTEDLKETLKTINPNLEVLVIRGWSPGNR
ncbi:hypothetical protein SPFL3102_03549 [Sporomusaceae bacterium FL31]|nr:hypothetical protein SPFL3101_00456 [Sporomusaceae bacterium FL31]GCE35698.1 hypothetical protein SPFL3102_03549 [Sporomusaceae bacterium]